MLFWVRSHISCCYMCILCIQHKCFIKNVWRRFFESGVVVESHTIVQLHPIQHAELGDGPDIALNGGTLLVSSTYLRKLLLLY